MNNTTTDCTNNTGLEYNSQSDDFHMYIVTQYSMLIFQSYFTLKNTLYFMENNMLQSAISYGLSLVDNVFWYHYNYHKDQFQDPTKQKIQTQPFTSCLNKYLDFLINHSKSVTINTAYFLTVQTFLFGNDYTGSLTANFDVLRDNVKNICHLIDLFYLPKIMIHSNEEGKTKNSNVISHRNTIPKDKHFEKMITMFDPAEDYLQKQLPDSLEAFINQNQSLEQSKSSETAHEIIKQKEETLYKDNVINDYTVHQLFHHFFRHHCRQLSTVTFSFHTILMITKIANNFQNISTELVFVLLHFFLSKQLNCISDFTNKATISFNMINNEFKKDMVYCVILKLSSSITTLENPPDRNSAPFIEWISKSVKNLDKLDFSL